MTIFLFAVFAVACARITRILVTDRISQAWRARAIRKHGEDSLAAYFVVCPWCMSIWLSPLFAAGWLLSIHATGWQWAWIMPVSLTYSYITGLLARVEGD